MENDSTIETKLTFPKGFLIGASSSAHQAEGDNFNSDWYFWETQGKLPQSGKAADHYNRFDEDFELASQIGLNAIRISIEWARIEPVEGRWDTTAVEHYKKVLMKMKDLGLARMVTLWHYTLPKWLADKGGFENKEAAEAFARYAWFVAQNLGKEIDFWLTINEPEVYAFLSYQQGTYPPFKKNLLKTWKVLSNLIQAHKSAYKSIKESLGDVPVGIAKNLAYYEPYRKNNPADRVVSFVATILNRYVLEKIRREMDFIGLNYYFYNRMKFDFAKGFCEKNGNFQKGQLVLDDQKNRSDVGWVLHPQGIYHVLNDLKKFEKPIYVTECGIADAQDNRRKEFIREILSWTLKSMNEGADVKGFFYWSLTDNYEWSQGFGPRFGLVEIDYNTQKRIVRPSAAIIKEINFNG